MDKISEKPSQTLKSSNNLQDRGLSISERKRRNTILRTCDQLVKCSPEIREKCPVFQQNQSCWLFVEKCICPASDELICENCKYYKVHLNEIIKALSWRKKRKRLIREFTGHISPLYKKFLESRKKSLPIVKRRKRMLVNITAKVIKRCNIPRDVSLEKYLFKIFREVYPGIV